jgi:membrane protein YdbS with pleckstrin-like domain
MPTGFLVFLIIMITIVSVIMTNVAMFDFKQTPALSVWRAIVTIGILIVSVLVMCLVTPPEQEVWDKHQRELRNSAINDAIRNGKLNEQQIELYGKLPI